MRLVWKHSFCQNSSFMVSRFSFIDGSLFLHFVSVCFFPCQFSLLFVFISHCINDSFYIVLCQACDTLCHHVLKVVEIFIWSEASPCPLIYHWVWGSRDNIVLSKLSVHHAITFWISLKFWYQTRLHRALWFIIGCEARVKT